MKKALLWIGIGLVSFIVIIFIWGSLLPEKYNAQITVALKSSPEQVWAAVADFEKNPMSGAMREKTNKLPDENGLPVWVEDMGETALTIRTVAAHAPMHVKRTVADRVVPMTATWEITIEPADGGSRVTATNETIIRNGTWHVPLFRLILKYGSGADVGLRDYWAAVGRSLGETPQISGK